MREKKNNRVNEMQKGKWGDRKNEGSMKEWFFLPQ
jgi:hypothetical protein